MQLDRWPTLIFLLQLLIVVFVRVTFYAYSHYTVEVELLDMLVMHAPYIRATLTGYL